MTSHLTPEQAAGPRRGRAMRTSHASPEGNGRLTAMTGVVLFVLLALEGVTVLQVGALLTAHVVIGMILVPPVLVKLASTGWRMARYYLGDPAYRRKGPPALLLRLLGPFDVVLTVAVFASGIALLYVPAGSRSQVLFVHKASFVLWFCAMSVHVLGHVLDTAKLAPRDYLPASRRTAPGAAWRAGTLAASLVAGVALAALVAPQASHWIGSSFGQ